MAERRMFSRQVTESDAFLDMPQTTQNFYFHLGMSADDEGFVSSPKKILRMIGANANDLDILLAKRYIVGFESGIIVIKHWKLNNQIRKDRLKDTVYLEEKSMLEEKVNGVYSLISNDYETLQPIDNQLTTNCPPSIVEVSVVEDSVEPLKKPTKTKPKIVNNYKKWTVEEFTEEIKKHGEDYTSDMKNDFYRYWSEPNEKGKMLFQLKTSWCTSRRLATWYNRSK